jgi:aminopeptidase N
VRHRPILDSSATDLMSLLNPNNYQKGSWVLHSLRGLVGDSAFFQGLRTFYERYRHGNALSRDFARVMEAAAGRDLEWFFRQALTQPGYPVLQVEIRREGESAAVEVTQVQDPAWGTFRIPGLVLELDGQRITLDVDGRTTRKALSTRGSGVPALKVDPDGWWLLEVREPGKP